MLKHILFDTLMGCIETKAQADINKQTPTTQIKPMETDARSIELNVEAARFELRRLKELRECYNKSYETSIGQRWIRARHRAITAVESLEERCLNSQKASRCPQEILMLVMDGLSIIFRLRLAPVQLLHEIPINRDTKVAFWKNSFEESGKYIMGPNFDMHRQMATFNVDTMNGETAQLLEPLLVDSCDWFNETNCNKISKACEACFKWCLATYESYHFMVVGKSMRDSLQEMDRRVDEQQRKVEQTSLELKQKRDCIRQEAGQ